MMTTVSYTLYSRNPKDNYSHPTLIINTMVIHNGKAVHSHTDIKTAEFDWELRELWGMWKEFLGETAGTIERWHNHGCLGTSMTVKKTWVA